MAWISLCLGQVYKYLGQYDQAKSPLEKSYAIYEKQYGQSHFETARILQDIGELYLLKGDLESAEVYVSKALSLFQKNKHPDAYDPLEVLATLYLKKANMAEKTGNYQQAISLKKQGA